MSVEDRARRVSAEHLGIEPDKITATANFREDLGADSLDIVELAMAYEEEFNIEIPDDVLEQIKTFGDAVAQIDTALS